MWKEKKRNGKKRIRNGQKRKTLFWKTEEGNNTTKSYFQKYMFYSIEEEKKK